MAPLPTVASGTRETGPNNLRSSAEKADANIPLYHSAVPQRQALPMRWFMAKPTLVVSEAKE